MKSSEDLDQLLTKPADLGLHCFQERCNIYENAMFYLDEYYETLVT